MINRLKLYLLHTLVLISIVGCGERTIAESIESAKSFADKSDYAAATVELKGILLKKPDNADARMLLGQALLEQGEVASALLEVEKARELGFSEEQVVPLNARLLVLTGKYKEAKDRFGEVELKAPAARADLKTSLAEANIALGRRSEAEVLINAALQLAPTFDRALLLKARLLGSDGNIDGALSMSERVLADTKSIGEAQLLRGALLQFGRKDYDGAIKAFQAASGDKRVSGRAHASLIQLYLSQQKIDAARDELGKLRKSSPTRVQTVYLDAVVSYAAKDYRRAEGLVDQLLGVAPQSGPLLILGGASSLQRGALVPAEAKLGKAVQTLEGASIARKLLAETYLRMGRPEKALRSIQALLESKSADAEVLAMAGQAYLQLGDLSNSESYFAAAVKLKPDDSNIRTALALAELVKGNFDLALTTLRGIAETDASDVADLALISAQLRRRNFDQALAAVDRLASKPSGKLKAQQLRGGVLRAKGDVAGARKVFEELSAADRTNTLAILALSEMDFEEKRYESSRTRLNQAINADPKNITLRMALLRQLEKTGAKPDQMLNVIDDAIRANASEPEPHIRKINYLASVGELRSASTAAQNAIAQIPNNADILDVAGVVFGRSGEDQQAINAFGKLASLKPQSPLAHLRLADLYLKKGDASAARVSLDRAFELAPRSREVHRRLLAMAVPGGDPKPAQTAAKNLQKNMPGSAIGWVLEGDLQDLRKNRQAALEAYRAALGKSDLGSLPQAKVYDLNLQTAGVPVAERFAVQWLQSNVGDFDFVEHLGNAALLRGDFVLAETRFQSLLKLRPKSTSALNNLAWLRAKRGDVSSIRLAEQALETAPESAAIHDTLAMALSVGGQIDKAIQIQRKAVALAPDRVPFRLALIRLLVKQGDRNGARQEFGALEKLPKLPVAAGDVAELRTLLAK